MNDHLGVHRLHCHYVTFHRTFCSLSNSSISSEIIFFNIIISNDIIIIITNINEHISWTSEIHLVREGSIIFKKNADCEPAECTPLYFFVKTNSLLNWLAGLHKIVQVFSQLTDLLKAEAENWVKT